MKNKILQTAAIAMFAVPFSAQSTTISGILNTAGSATVTSSTLSFYDMAGANLFATELPLTGSFTGSTGGTIGNLVAPPFSPASPVVDFITVTGGMGFTNVKFDLISIPNGSGGLAGCSGAAATMAGSTCTPLVQIGSSFYVSPFLLVNNTDGSVTITLTTNLEGYTGTSATGETAYLGTFSTNQSNATIASVLAQLSANGSVAASYSANFSSSSVPEPATIYSFGGSLLAIGLGFVRKRSSNR